MENNLDNCEQRLALASKNKQEHPWLNEWRQIPKLIVCPQLEREIGSHYML